MFSKALFASAILALSSTVVQAQTDEEKAKYPDWTGAMNLFRYDWKPYEVKTEDGYTLTIMNVTKKHSDWRVKAKLNPIIVQGIPGIQPDLQVSMYILVPPVDIPVPFKLLDEGHDLWYIYNRGGTYSQKHDSMSVYDADFWNFNFEQIGRYDVKAAMDFVYTKTGKKTALYAVGGGTDAVLAGLTTDYEWFKERTYKVALQQPCTVWTPESLVNINATTVPLYKAQGIFELGGPTWYKTAGKYKNIVGPEMFRSTVLTGYPAYYKGVSEQTFDTLAQNTQMNRFQRWSDTFWATPQGEETELYDLSVIKDIPVAMLMAKDNKDCTMAQNEITKQQIGAMVQMYKTYDQGDLNVYNGKDMNDDLVNFLSDKFTPNVVPSMILQ